MHLCPRILQRVRPDKPARWDEQQEPVGKFHHDPIEEVILVRTGERTLSLARGHRVEEQYECVGNVFRLIAISVDFAYDALGRRLYKHSRSKYRDRPQAGPVWNENARRQRDEELTDEDGQMAWSGTYKAWGFAEEKRNDAVRTVKIGNQLRFQGQYFDSETKLHYNRHRYYAPQIGRFVGKDPISFSGGINIYQYAPNSTQWIDPLGLARSGQWVAVGNGRIRIDPPHVENTDQQVHAHCQCKTRRREVVINKDGSQSHKSRGSSTELTRTEKDFLRDKGFKL